MCKELVGEMKTFLFFLGGLKLASKTKKRFVMAKSSKSVENFLRFLQREGFIYTFALEGSLVRVHLKYKGNGEGFFDDLEVYSKGSKKVYWNVEKCSFIRKHSSSMIVLSTSQGLLFAHEAHRRNIGGMVLCSFNI